MERELSRVPADPVPALSSAMTPDPALQQESGRHLPIGTDSDLAAARQQVLALVRKHAASDSDALIVATITSELCRNILEYAGNGVIEIREQTESGRRGIRIVAVDHGPGIADCAAALTRGCSTSGGAGLGLPGVQSLADEFHLDSGADRGTRVTVTKWLD